MIELSAADGHTFCAYRADPAGVPKGAVVVIQEVFGVTAHVRKLADDFAAQGYVAIAPALFDRVQSHVDLAYDADGLRDGLGLVEQVSDAAALGDIQASVDAVKGAGRVAVVGYSWGGYLAYLAANQVKDLACAISYYGGGIVEATGAKRKIPTLLHFGERDPLIPLDLVGQFRERRPDVSAFCYPGAAHGFNCDAQSTYDPVAAHQAQGRTLFWISQYVEGQAPIALKNSGLYAQAKTDKKSDKKKGKAPGGDDLGPPLD